MSRSFQPKTPIIKTSCDSYIRTISDLRYQLEGLETLNQEQKEHHKQEVFFLRGAIAIALGLGFVVGVLTKGHL